MSDNVHPQKDNVQHPHVIEEVQRLKGGHEDSFHVGLCDWVDDKIKAIATLFAWANALLIGAIILNVVLRYGFHNGLIILEELQWHLYATAVMFGVSYAIVMDSHIRVDILYHNFSDRSKRLVEVFGIVFFILPFAWVIFSHGLDFAYEAWRVSERSESPTGLPARWLIKSVIPISFGLVIIAALSRLVRDGVALVKGGK